MTRKRITLTTLVTISALSVASVAQANDLVKGLVAAGAGALIYCGATGKCQPGQKTQRRTTTTTSRQAVNPARAQNRQVQSALNAFGFDVGTPDGALGPKSRAGISSYQSYMGYPPSGYLDDFQRSQLLESHSRLNAGAGAAYPHVVAQEGTKGLLKAFRDPNYAASGTTAPAYNAADAPQPQTQLPLPVPAPAPVAPATTAATLEPLAPLAPFKATQASMSERCELVGLMTQTNQGLMQASNVSDPDQALSEQFCEARSYSMAIGQTMADNAGLDDASVDQTCGQIAKGMRPVIATLNDKDPGQIVADASSVSTSLGASDPQAASAYGQICIGAGYRKDDPEVAMAGTMMLVGAGQAPYGELLGHHLREGFGTQKDSPASEMWFDTALRALEANQPSAFLPSKTPERIAVMRAAITMGGLQAGILPGAGVPVPVSYKLPALQAQ